MGSPEKKKLKAEAKQAKKAAKAGGHRPETRGASVGVRFADIVRGVLYLLLGASLAVALLLGQRGAIISLEDVIDSLFAAWTGKVVLAVIALALVIYGLKHLRVVR